MWIVLWDPFLMKKLIKSEVCGVCKQCISALFTEEWVNHCGWKGKKKNWGNAYVALISAIQTSIILGSFPPKKKKKNFILGVQIMDLKWF